MTNGQKMRKLFEEKKLVVAPGCHDALTAKIISYLGFDAVYMTGYGPERLPPRPARRRPG